MIPRKTGNRVKLLVVLFLTFPLLSGCWDRLELEERAIVLAVGIDQAAPEDEKKEPQVSHAGGTLPPPNTGMIRISAQIAVPGRIPLGPGGGSGGGGGGAGGGQKTVWVVETVGHTINDAVNNLQQKVGPPLFFGHLRVIVVSEAIARKGIENLNDFFRRNPEVRRMNWMFVCKDEAVKVLKASPQLERVPALYLVGMMNRSVRMGRFPNTFLGIFWSAVSAKGREGYLPYITLKGQQAVETSGMAYFKKNTMVGVTQPLQIHIFMGITGVRTAGGDAFVKVPGTSDFVLVNVRNRRSTIKAEIRNGKPHIAVRIQLEANLLEKSNETVKLNTSVIKQAENTFNKTSGKAYVDLIKQTQEKGSDIFAFGERIRAKYPQYWNQHIKTKENWEKLYKDLTVEVTVDSHIRRIGMKAT